MKIIMTDNYARDYVDDILICENVSRVYGTIIVECLNNHITCTHDKYFILVNDDYKLVKFEP